MVCKKSIGHIIIMSIFITFTLSFNIWAAVEGTLKWRYRTGNYSFDFIHSSPAVDDDGTIYFISTDDYLYALNSDGSLKWRTETDISAYPSPAIGGDGTIYIGDGSRLMAVDQNGAIKWQYDDYWQFHPYEKSSPAISSDGTIYVGSLDDHLYAVNNNGTLKWRYDCAGDVVSAPAIDSDGTIYVGTTNAWFYALHSNGTLKWGYNVGDSIVSSPAINNSDGTIYFGSMDHYLYALNSDGSLKWQYDTGSYIKSSPAIDSDGTIYIASYSGLCAVNKDGVFKWHYDLEYCGTYSSPAIGSDGTIYVGSSYGYLYALNSDGTLKWQYDTGGYINSSPTIGSDGTIYVGNNAADLYAINSSSNGLATTPWPMFHHDLRHTGLIKQYVDTDDDGLVGESDVEGFVTRFYQQCLNRYPDEQGLAGWVGSLNSGEMTGKELAQAFVFSEEFQNLNTSDSEFMTILYRAFFNREPDTDGYNHWMNELSNGTSRSNVLDGFISAQEFITLCQDYGIIAISTDTTDDNAVAGFVTRFYQQCLNREPDTEGLNHWVDSLNNGDQTGAELAKAFVFSEEFQNLNTSDSEFMTILYRAFFNREPDTDGYNHWMNELSNGTSRSNVLDGFISAQEFITLCQDYGITAISPDTRDDTNIIDYGGIWKITDHQYYSSDNEYDPDETSVATIVQNGNQLTIYDSGRAFYAVISGDEFDFNPYQEGYMEGTLTFYISGRFTSSTEFDATQIITWTDGNNFWEGCWTLEGIKLSSD